MKTQSIVVPILLLTVVPCIGMAETPRGQLASEAVDPPTLQHIVATAATQPRGAIAELLAVEPQIPLGPLDVLRQYENEMTLITKRLSAEMATIIQAVLANKITRDEAEYFIQERYQVAVVQHEVLGALHDSLEHDVAQVAAKRSGTVSQSDTVVVVQPSLSGHLQAR